MSRSSGRRRADVFPSSQRSIQSCPAGQLHNSKEVGRTKTKDLSSYFLERGGCAAPGWSVRKRFAVLTTPSAPSLCSAQPPLLCEEGNLHKEAFKGFDHALRRFLRQIVAGIERPAGHVGRGFAPDGEEVVLVKHSCVASAPPHDQHGCGDFAPGLVIRLVVPEIDSRGRAIVLARTVNRLWGEAADVFADSPIVKERGLAGTAKVAQH